MDEFEVVSGEPPCDDAHSNRAASATASARPEGRQGTLIQPSPLFQEVRNLRDGEAEYALEYTALCPSCKSPIPTIKVVRLLRTRVNFTSTLPRHGRVMICPECRAILSATLTVL